MIRKNVLVLLLIVGGCESAVKRDTSSVADARAVEPHATALEESAQVAPDVSVPVTQKSDDKKYSDRCPTGMREVEGTACESVTHLCVEGRNVVYGEPLAKGGILPIIGTVPVHCPNGCATPYYCDKFLPGSAQCSGKTASMHFCMDDGEYPNVNGEMPRVRVTWNEADSLCKAQNKRLCGDDEWTFACEGPEHLPYSYGWERDAKKCYIDHAKADGPQPVLSSPNCTSPFGVHDMNGNVDEWTRNVTQHGKPYSSMFKGGHWVEGARDRCRPNTDSHGPTFSFYAEGFRCCGDVAASAH